MTSTSGPNGKFAIVAELDLGADRDGRLEDERLALLRLEDLHVGVGQGQDVLLDQGLAVDVLHEVVDGLVEDDARAEVALEHRAGRLARPEAGDAGPPGEGADRLVEGLVQALGRDLDLEQDGRLRGSGSGDVHRPRSIGRAPPRRPSRPAPGAGRRERGRTSTPLTRHRLLRPARLPFRHSPVAVESSAPGRAGRPSRGVRVVRSRLPGPRRCPRDRVRGRARMASRRSWNERGSGANRKSAAVLAPRWTRGWKRLNRMRLRRSLRDFWACWAYAAKSRSRVPRTLAAVGAHLAQGLLDLVGQHRLGQRGVLAADQPVDPARRCAAGP